jgi:hypothetical protein
MSINKKAGFWKPAVKVLKNSRNCFSRMKRIPGASVLQYMCLFAYRLNRNVDPVIFPFPEFNLPVGKSKECMVFSQSDVGSGVVSCSALTDNYIPGFGDLTAEELDAQTLALGIATVA